MKLFIVKEVLYDYSGGMVAIKAHNSAEARIFFINWIEQYCIPHYIERFIKEFDTSWKAGYYHVFELSDKDKNEAGVVTQIWGGG